MTERDSISPLALRCYVGNSSRYYGDSDGKSKPNNYVTLVIDTETRIDEGQVLLHGCCDVWLGDKLHETYIFYGDHLSKWEIDIIKQHGAKLGCTVLSRKDFVEKVFFPYAYQARARCVGFNLRFDLTRLQIRATYSLKKSFREGFSLILSDDDRFPNIDIKSISSKASFIEFTKPSRSTTEKKYKHFKGCFVDLMAVGFTLTNGEIHDEYGHLLTLTLENYGVAFGCSVKKTKPKKLGIVCTENIDYNINDVRLTHELLVKLEARFALHDLNKNLSELYSPASTGKAYLEKMGIRPFLQKNPQFPKYALDNLMRGYYGGKTEAPCVKQPVPVSYLDATSMYPTVYTLLNLDRFVKANKIIITHSTNEIQQLLDKVVLDDIADKEFWADANLITICKIAPDYDLLPARSRYGSKRTWNIGVNYVKSADGIGVWVTLPDLIASKLLTGKTPIIQEALSFKADRVQEGLVEVEILKGVSVKPDENWIQRLIEERIKIKQKIKSLKGEEKQRAILAQNILKIIANSACYGIFIEINPEHSKEAERVVLHGLEDCEVELDTVEKEGRMYNPVLGVIIPAAARLMLAAAQAAVERNGGYVAYTDTDSVFVSPDHVRYIQEYFRELKPYSVEVQVFKVEEDESGKKLDNVLLYAISSKRYVLYDRNESTGAITIRKYSSHGLGYLEGVDEEQWWRDILEIHYHPDMKQEILAKYADKYAHVQLSITNYDTYKRFRHYNKGKPPTKQIQPFNFITVGLAYRINPHTQEPIIPMLPYIDRKRSKEIPYLPFTDYKTGDRYPDQNSLPTEYYWKPLSQVIEEFIKHPESKFEGEKGWLSRRRVIFDKTSIHYIGKESNNLEIAARLGSQADDTLDYTMAKKGLRERLLDHKASFMAAKPIDVKPFGLSRQELWNVKRCLHNGGHKRLKDKVVKRLNAYLDSLSITDA